MCKKSRDSAGFSRLYAEFLYFRKHGEGFVTVRPKLLPFTRESQTGSTWKSFPAGGRPVWMQTRFRNRNRKVARRIARPSFRGLYTPPGDAKLRNLCSRPFDTARKTQRYTRGYHHSGEINYTRNNNRLLYSRRDEWWELPVPFLKTASLPGGFMTSKRKSLWHAARDERCIAAVV